MSTTPNPFSSMVETMDNLCLNTFGTAATWYPQSGGNFPFTGIFERPPMYEDLLPSLGTSVIRFFVRFVDFQAPGPKHGDVVVVGPSSYDIFEVEVDNEGGGVLLLRINDK